MALVAHILGPKHESILPFFGGIAGGCLEEARDTFVRMVMPRNTCQFSF